MIRFKFKASWDSATDKFRFEFLILGASVMALVFNYKFTIIEVLWSFSIFLEAVSILPQLFMLQDTGECETINSHYLFALGAYRVFYLLNWIYRYATEGHTDWILWVAGTVQGIIFGDFFYIYFTRILRGQKFELPA